MGALTFDFGEIFMLYNGRPTDIEGREERELRTYDLLDGLGIEYVRVDHAPAMTMADCEAIDGELGTRMCKNLFLCNRQATDFYLLLIPGDKPFKTKELSAQIGTARLSFASGEKMLELLDINPGAVSVMGLMNDKEKRVDLLVDRELLSCEYLGCHPCVNTSSIRVKTSDIFDIFLKHVGHTPRIVELSGKD